MLQSKNLIIFLFLVISTNLYSQQYKKKKGAGLYSTGQNEIDKGWYFGLGGTYMLRYLSESSSINTIDTLNNRFDQNFKATPKGKLGLYGEIGLFRMNDKRFINYIDFGLAYKWLRGGEDYLNENFRNDTLFSTTSIEGSYSDHLLSGHLNLGYRFDASDKMFFVNGLGLNADYHLITSRTGTPALPENEYKDGPNSFLGEMHYFFGMGFKTGKRLIIMPMIETPILALLPFNHIASTHDYFNTRSRPILFRVRFMFLKKGSKSCPPVYNPMGIDPNGNGVK